MSMMKFTSNSRAQTVELGKRLGERLKSGDVVLFSGGLGAGKTAFVSGIAAGMGIDKNVTSPTFAIVNEYGGDPALFHFDMYRIESSDQLYNIGFDDYLERGGVCAIEWSENVADYFGDDVIKVNIEHEGEGRRITISGLDCEL